MRTLKDINSDDEFFVTAYTDFGGYMKPTDGLTCAEHIISKENTKDFFFFLANNDTKILSEIENDLQSLCNKNNRELLSAMINIELAIDFTKDAMLLSGGFCKDHMRVIFFNLLKHLNDAKKQGSNIIAFEGYKNMQ